METLIKPIKLSEINYPVYKVGTELPTFINDIVLYIRQYDTGDEIKTTYQIIDDKSIKQPSLGKRRLLLINNGIKVKRLNKAIFFLGDLIKIAKANTIFIDSSGSIFTYKKQTKYKLISKKIEKIIKIKTGGVILELKNSTNRHKALYGPMNDQKYALVLENAFDEILYGFSDKIISPSWRLV